jgi:uncharacterized protein YndB with AHSA1/START domain
MITLIAVVVVIVLVGVVGLLAVAANKPDTFRIQRAARIAAPPEKIFPLINDLRAHSAWSPFEQDPAMKRVHSGAGSGKGAVYEWDGNRKVGTGRIQIIDSVPPSAVAMKLDMFTPFEAHNIVEFTLEAEDGATNVTWAMQGAQPYLAKLIGTVVNCDRMVGRQFEQGLARMKALAET